MKRRAFLIALILVLPAIVVTQIVKNIVRISVDSAGVQGSAVSGVPRIAANGRFTCFESEATNLVPGDTNGYKDIFVHDLQAKATTRVSVDSAGTEADFRSRNCAISADGRFVAFNSGAQNWAIGGVQPTSDVYLRDTQTNTTTRISKVGPLNLAFIRSDKVAISADGRFVAYDSDYKNQVPNDTNNALDVFVVDRNSGVIERVSVNTAGVQANAVQGSGDPAISSDGRFVAFLSDATNLAPASPPGFNVYLRDRTGPPAATTLVGPGTGSLRSVAISGDGRLIAFVTSAALAPNDTNGVADVVVFDRVGGSFALASVGPTGTLANGASESVQISQDGRFVVFASDATNLVAGDTNGVRDVFVRDRNDNSTRRVSVDSLGTQANGTCGAPDTTTDAMTIAFQSDASNLVANDTNAVGDVFVVERGFLPPPDTGGPSGWWCIPIRGPFKSWTGYWGSMVRCFTLPLGFVFVLVLALRRLFPRPNPLPPPGPGPNPPGPPPPR